MLQCILWSNCEKIKSGIPALPQVSTAERKEEERKTCKVRNVTAKTF